MSRCTAKHICTPDNDGHCHWCGLVINEDYHEAAGCECQSKESGMSTEELWLMLEQYRDKKEK